MTTKLMTNLDLEYYQFLDDLSKKMKITKKQILEKALTMYRAFLEKQEMEKQYSAMGKDKEYLQEMQENSSYLGTL